MLQFVLLLNWMLVVYLWIDQVFLPICSSFRATLSRRPVPQRRRRPSKHWSNQEGKSGEINNNKNHPATKYLSRQNMTGFYVEIHSNAIWHAAVPKLAFCKVKTKSGGFERPTHEMHPIHLLLFFREKLDSLVRNRKLMQSVVRRSIEIVFFRPFFFNFGQE